MSEPTLLRRFRSWLAGLLFLAAGRLDSAYDVWLDNAEPGMTARAYRPVDVAEREFTAQVIELARLLGYRAAHFRPAWTGRGWRTPVQGDGAGFPDLVLLRNREPRRLAPGLDAIAVELR